MGLLMVQLEYRGWINVVEKPGKVKYVVMSKSGPFRSHLPPLTYC